MNAWSSGQTQFYKDQVHTRIAFKYVEYGTVSQDCSLVDEGKQGRN